MSAEDFIKLCCRAQWRDEGDLNPPKGLTLAEREYWVKEARKIELEEMQSA